MNGLSYWMATLVSILVLLFGLVGCQKPRVLVVQVDNRGLPEIEGGNATQAENRESQLSTASYWSLTPVLNHHYCRRHGYDYLLIQPLVNETEILRSLGSSTSGIEGWDRSTKDGRAAIGAVHPGLGQARAASWAKLPTLLFVLLQLGTSYDLVWYLDSDIGISDQVSGRSLQEKFDEWASGSKCLGPPRNTSCINWGVQDVFSSPMLLFPNSPFGDREPCAGTFMLRPNTAASMLLEWWDVNMPHKNFGLMHEQDALWNLTSSDRVRELMLAAREREQAAGRNPDQAVIDPRHLTSKTVTLLQEFQFPPNGPPNSPEKHQRCVGGKQWLCHIITTDHEQRAPWFREMLAKPENGGYTQQRFHAALRHIRNALWMQLDVLRAAETVERHRAVLRENRLGEGVLGAAERVQNPRGLSHAHQSQTQQQVNSRSSSSSSSS